ncbi:heme ABC exporter ATP-binding protein CcmA [Vreelandella sulfidaeris]|uniref:Heme ABC exporter ATP-binding protein CcmA n=1 Tax=Vreelandella sulfidaeris TaxID=115553 RepID=A0A365TJ35_9GAMM|nr:heme ABC exporter ATP-binding protein CcmA [Halomonas sulfidaeris]RBI65282.1 heme ABC exporter ATP-binding protein CcmA [Halomonas sulfidaeris]
MTATAALTIDQLRVVYGSHSALDDVSLQVRPGEILGILGPNGAGKSTLLRAITGKLRPTSGQIFIAGKALSPGKAYQHSIGFTPQFLGLYRHLTGRENLEFFACCAGVSRQQVRARVSQALEEIELTDKAHVRVDQLSGGMQRRLHLAATLVSHPSLLVLDEPTAGVDLGVRMSIHDLIRRRAEQGTAVVVVTHELDEAEALSHRVALLHQGQLKALAEPQTLVHETFGNSQLLVVRTVHLFSPALCERLQEIGFCRDSDESNEWWLQSDLPLDRLINHLYRGLGGARDAIAEVSVRRPGLKNVMQHFTGARTDSAAETVS